MVYTGTITVDTGITCCFSTGLPSIHTLTFPRSERIMATSAHHTDGTTPLVRPPIPSYHIATPVAPLLSNRHSSTRHQCKRCSGAGNRGSWQRVINGYPCLHCYEPCPGPVDAMPVDVVAQRAGAVESGGGGDCDEDAATVHCIDCNSVWCDDCNESTHRKGTRKDHARVPIVDLLATTAEAANVDQDVMCHWLTVRQTYLSPTLTSNW
jgi:hypothetical protein